MNNKLIHRIFAAVVFLISTVVLIMTVQPSVSFWDCGEFIAASYYLQVPHPPGTPFFLILGRIFSLIPFVENIALRVNYISILSTSLSVLFLYLISVKLIGNFKGLIFTDEHHDDKNKFNFSFEPIIVFLVSAIGALSFSFADTVWFNGVEAEVYALSTVLFAAIVWLILVWHEKADEPGSVRYIWMIAYLIGLSTGVHLMSVLAAVPVVMIIMFRKYLDDELHLKQTGFIFIGHAVVLFLVAVLMWGAEKSSEIPRPEVYQAFDSKMKIIFVVISIIIMAVFYKKIFTRNSFYLPIMFGGVALALTYPGIVKYVPNLLATIAGDNVTVGIIVLAIALAGLFFLVKYANDKNMPTLHLIGMSAIFAVIGFTTFAMVIIRSNQNPPMNENEPDTFTELVSYLNREQYGDFPTFKRRFASENHQMGVYQNYSSDLDFFWKYQMNHMMTRYMLWNYSGRESWDQDANANMWPFNGIASFFGKFFNIKFQGTAKDSLFGIPLILGLLGLYYHFRKDWKMASAFLILFIFMGYLTAFYQNQQQPQPRERDYFYVGAFFVYSIWIALGLLGLIDYVLYKIKNNSLAKATAFALVLFGIVFVPVNMVRANYFNHDRSNNWVPWDYAYNLLQSCAPNAILFTNGDNDTFPLWYLQDVEGIRRDVKIVNLSLVNTEWYISQMKNNDPYKVGTVKMRLRDEEIANINQIYSSEFKPQEVRIPIPDINQLAPELRPYYADADSVTKANKALTFIMRPTIPVQQSGIIRPQDYMVREIITSNNWERPIYFAITCSEDSKIGLSDYLVMEGMASRLVPRKRDANEQIYINPEILAKQLLTNDEGFSKDYKPGYKFRGLGDSSIFLDENHFRMTYNYRTMFFFLARHYAGIGQKEEARKVLAALESKVSNVRMIEDPSYIYNISMVYYQVGDMQKYREMTKGLIKTLEQSINENPYNLSSYSNPYTMLREVYSKLNEYDKEIDILNRLKALFPQDHPTRAQLDNEIKFVQMKKEGKIPDSLKDTLQ